MTNARSQTIETQNHDTQNHEGESPMIETPTATTTTPDPLALKAALDSKREELLRMSPAELVERPALDAAVAADLAMGCLARIAPYRDEMVAKFGAEAAACIDDLPATVYATLQASIDLAASDAASDLSDLHADIAREHELLLTDADALANRKLLDRARVDQGRPAQGYRTTLTSTLVLISLLRESWSRISSRTPLGLADLDRIERKALDMRTRLNEREQGTSRLPAVDLRARALSMLIRQYGEVRRMLTYVRWWSEDADSIAPSLWSGRRRRSEAQAPAPAAIPAAPATAPAATNDGPFTA